MRPIPAISDLAPAPTAADLEALVLEQLVGEAAAVAASTIAQALREFERGGLTHQTKMSGGDAIARLFALRQTTAGQFDFDAVARSRGVQILRELCDTNVSTSALNTLIEGTLDILHEVIKSQSN